MDVKPHPLEGKLIELESKATEARRNADELFAAAREADRQFIELMTEAKIVAARLEEYDRQQAAG